MAMSLVKETVSIFFKKSGGQFQSLWPWQLKTNVNVGIINSGDVQIDFSYLRELKV